MKPIKFRFLPALLALALCFGSFPAVAYAQADPDGEAETAAPEPEKEPGEPLSEGSGIVTRDLLYDKATNKQFITIQDREGNIFYLVIDYDAPVDGDEEQYATYFLNPVDTADLAALAEETAETAPPACSCKDRCAPGSIDMGCPVCAADMTACAGKEPEPEETPPPAEPEEPEPEEMDGKNPAGAVLALLLFAALAGGGAFSYLKFAKKKKAAKPSTDLDDYDFEDDEKDDPEAPDDGTDMEDSGDGAESGDE